MKLNWLIGGALAVLIFGTASEAARPVIALVNGAETQDEMFQMGFHAVVMAVFFWFVNVVLYSICVRILPLHPFLKDSLLFFKKSVNAYIIMWFVLCGYFLYFLVMKQMMEAALCALAAWILMDKISLPWDFFKAHVVEYEGHFEKDEEKSDKTIDSDEDKH